MGNCVLIKRYHIIFDSPQIIAEKIVQFAISTICNTYDRWSCHPNKSLKQRIRQILGTQLFLPPCSKQKKKGKKSVSLNGDFYSTHDLEIFVMFGYFLWFIRVVEDVWEASYRLFRQILRYFPWNLVYSSFREVEWRIIFF